MIATITLPPKTGRFERFTLSESQVGLTLVLKSDLCDARDDQVSAVPRTVQSQHQRREAAASPLNPH